MKPSEIRKELLDEHAKLRAAMQIARAAGDRRASIARLAEVLRAHNLREEELMSQVFPTLDAWGGMRALVMLEGHVEEEQLFAAHLAGGATKAPDLFDRILEHMAREEKVFLGEDVLSDDELAPDSFGG